MHYIHISTTCGRRSMNFAVRYIYNHLIFLSGFRKNMTSIMRFSLFGGLCVCYSLKRILPIDMHYTYAVDWFPIPINSYD